ncbi:transmembrane 7 superfamily member 3-like isoform X2 [Rhynchophorus ferrugineus]|uniref:transmembrane 7 superfamily member 3-like isoform X2 n=1 Tax=Rhynchophorus ferrugineus TaxID=354439 RepID=UPI003FCCCAF2
MDLMNQVRDHWNQRKIHGLYKNNYVLSEDTTAVILLGLNDNCRFLIFQVHTYIESVTLSYSKETKPSRHVNGTNVGLYWGKNMMSNYTNRPITFFINRFKNIDKPLNALLIINTYDYNDPIPGGCNHSFETEVAPYQKIVYDTNSIYVSAQAPSNYTGLFPNCDPTNISTVPYYMFISKIPQMSEDLYFGAINKMITIADIHKYGIPVKQKVEYLKFKQQYSIVKGTGYVFTMVSTLNYRTSLYVPAISFGCDISNWEEDCVEYDIQWKIMYSILIICGILICFFGPWFIDYCVFLCGFALASLIVIISSLGNWILASFIGLCNGTFLLLCLKRFKKPLCAVQGIFLLSGFILSSFCVFAVGASSKNNENSGLWALLVVTWILCYVLQSRNTHYGLAVALPFLGSFAFVYGVSAFCESNFPYLLVNGIRALSERNAVIAIPFDLKDISMTLLLILFFGIGFSIHNRQLKSRFPIVEEEVVNELAEEGQEITIPNETSSLLLNN